MAKTVKTKKEDVILLFGLWNKAPTSKIASDTAKYIAVRKAFKKPIKKYIEDRTEIEAQAREKLLELDKKYLSPLRIKRDKAEDEVIKKELSKQLTKKAEELNAYIVPYNQKMTNLLEAVRNEEVEVVFDNEDFLYFSDFMKTNGAELCTFEGRSNGEGKEPEKQLDPEALEKVFDFIAAAQ